MSRIKLSVAGVLALALLFGMVPTTSAASDFGSDVNMNAMFNLCMGPRSAAFTELYSSMVFNARNAKDLNAYGAGIYARANVISDNFDKCMCGDAPAKGGVMLPQARTEALKKFTTYIESLKKFKSTKMPGGMVSVPLAFQ